MKKNAKKKTKNQRRSKKFFLQNTKKRRGRKKKVRQKEEFQKEARKNLHSPRKNAKRKNGKRFFSQREETFSPNNITKVEEGETFSWRNFPKKKKVKRNCFVDFSFFDENFDKEKTGDEKGGMNEKEREVEK